MYLLSLLDLYNWLFLTFVCLLIRTGKKQIWQFMKFFVGIVSLDNIFPLVTQLLFTFTRNVVTGFFLLKDARLGPSTWEE